MLFAVAIVRKIRMFLSFRRIRKLPKSKLPLQTLVLKMCMIGGSDDGVVEHWPVVCFFVPAIQNHAFVERFTCSCKGLRHQGVKGFQNVKELIQENSMWDDSLSELHRGHISLSFIRLALSNLDCVAKML